MSHLPIDLKFHASVLTEVESFITSGQSGQYSADILANRTLYLLSFPIVLLTLLYGLIQALALTRLALRNPYWPFDPGFANQMNELARAHRDALNKGSS